MRLLLDFQLVKSDFCLQVDTALALSGVTAIWGASGSGKSLLLRVIAGFELSGTKAITLMDDNSEGVVNWRHNLAYVSQEAYLFPHLTVAGNLDFAQKRAQQTAHIDVDTVLDALEIKPLLPLSIASLSGGQRQRVAIAQALLTQAKIVLLDEPLSAIDGNSRERILRFLQHLKNAYQLTMIYVSHSYEEILQLADSVLVLDGGQVLAHKSLNDIVSHHEAQLVPQSQLCSLINGKITVIEPDNGLAYVEYSGGTIVKSLKQNVTVGGNIDLVIYAEDVSIALSQAKDSTILNCLAAVILSISDFDSNKKYICLAVGSDRLSAIVTNKSYQNLALHQGKAVFAQFKAVSLIRMH